MEERVVFGNTIDGMMNKALTGRMTPQLKSRLKLQGLDLDERIRAGYPYEDWKRWAGIVAEDVFPDLLAPERYRQLGRTVVFGIRHTTLGKAIEVVLQIIGPKRALERMNKNFRTSDNFSQATVTALGPRELHVHMNEVMDQPTYMQGIFEAIVEVSGGKNAQAEILSVSLPTATYRITWT